MQRYESTGVPVKILSTKTSKAQVFTVHMRDLVDCKAMSPLLSRIALKKKKLVEILRVDTE